MKRVHSRRHRMPGRRRVRSMREVVEGVFNRFKGRSTDLRLGSKIQEVWARALGEPLAENLFPAGIHAGELLVGCRSSLWMGEAHYISEKILKALQECLRTSAIRRVRLRLMEEPAPEGCSAERSIGDSDPARSTEVSKPTIPAEKQALIAAAVASAPDDEIRAQLRRIFEKAVQANRS